MTKTIAPDLALRIVRRLCARHGVALFLPGDIPREAVVALVFAAHKVQGTGASFDHVRESITVTLPGVPSEASALLAMIPGVGAELSALCQRVGRPAVYLSPAALADGAGLLATIWHELGHVGTMHHGGLAWCLAYLLSPEARAAGEAPCYGAGISVAVALGADVDAEAARAKASLESYGLDDNARRLAHALIDSAAESVRAGDFGGVQDEVRAELAAEGLSL